MLGLDDLFECELPEGREKVPWHLMACILAIARLVEPSSELHIEDTWYLRTGPRARQSVPEPSLGFSPGTPQIGR